MMFKPVPLTYLNQNTSLLFAAVPEFEKLVKTVWTDAFVSNSASSSLGTTESRIRFENLLTDIITELASTKMVAFVGFPLLIYFACTHASAAVSG
jgi:hypothetical protein